VAYRIEYLPAAFHSLKKLPADIHRRIVAKIESLGANPRPSGAIKLTGREVYRIRVGDYRVVYGIADEKLVVLIVEVGHRREIYRDW